MTTKTAGADIVAGGTPSDFLTVRHLRAAGTDREIGHALATAARHAHGSVVGPTPAPDPVVQRARRAWFAANHPVLQERMAGVGEAFGVDPADDAWDLAWLGTYELPAGCSSVFYPGAGTKDGHSLLARNFDFPPWPTPRSPVAGRFPVSGRWRPTHGSWNCTRRVGIRPS